MKEGCEFKSHILKITEYMKYLNIAATSQDINL